MANLKELRIDGKLPSFADGGYPMYYLTRAGLAICPACANETDTSDPVVDGDVYWEGPALVCEDCGAMIDSAYGDPEAYAEIDVSERRADGHEYGTGNRISCYSAEELFDAIKDIFTKLEWEGYVIQSDLSGDGYRHIRAVSGDLARYINVDYRGA